jgi:uncharacterized membrane protein
MVGMKMTFYLFHTVLITPSEVCWPCTFVHALQLLTLGLGLGVQTFAWASAPNESRIDKDVASEDEK